MGFIDWNGTICGLPHWIGIPMNDTAAYINNILLATVSGSCAVFAFLSNLAIIVTIIKKPSLQKPCNILLCSLASTDCLTGFIVQPMFVAWRLVYQRVEQSCLHQALIFDIYYISMVFIGGLSFVNVLIISFDRHYALSRPLVYHSRATKEGAMKIAISTSVIWLLSTILILLILPPLPRFIAIIIAGVLFLVVPIANFTRMLFAIRHHNNQLGDAVASQQMSAVYQREKKVALDMSIVTILLMASLTPGFFMDIFQRYPRLHSVVLPWTLAMAFIPSSINPIIYFGRNKNLRNNLKSIMKI